MVPNDAVRYVFGVYKIFTVEGKALKEKEVKLGERSGDGGRDHRTALQRHGTGSPLPVEGQELKDGAPVQAGEIA